MDNQKSTEGKGSDASREGLGSNIGKSQNSGLSQGSSASGSSQSGSSGSLGSANASPSTAKPATGSSSGSIGGTSNAGSSQSSGNLGSQQSGSSAAGSSGNLGSTSGGNSALGSSGSTSGSSTGSTGSSSGNNLSSSLGSSSQQSDSGDQSSSQGAQSGIKAAMANVSPDKLHEKIDQVAQGAQPLVDRLVSTAHAGVDRISGMLSGASESIGQRKGQLGETYSAYSEKGTEYVKTNPGTALLVAGAVGFLLAKLLSSSDSGSNRRYYRDYRD